MAYLVLGRGEENAMLACADVGYRNGRALAACLVFTHWRAAEPARVVRATRDGVAEYEPGAFYKRELPVLLEALAQIPAPLDAVVVDGYVWLGDGAVPGLGARLYEALDRRTAVIGAAKSRFRGDCCSISVLRGGSVRPLFVTAAGMAPEAAADAIRSMHGDARIPTLLRLADNAARF